MKAKGFTLIEMVAVIIILAVMAATALPKFTSLTSEARYASIQGLSGGLRSAALLVKAKWSAAQSGTMDTIELYQVAGAAPVSVIISNDPTVNGYPTADSLGIVAAMEQQGGYQSGVDGQRWAFWPTGVAVSTACAAMYQSGVVTLTATKSDDCA